MAQMAVKDRRKGRGKEVVLSRIRMDHLNVTKVVPGKNPKIMVAVDTIERQNGEACQPTRCPFALAVQRALGLPKDSVYVMETYTYIVRGDRVDRYRNPAKLRAAIRAEDTETGHDFPGFPMGKIFNLIPAAGRKFGGLRAVREYARGHRRQRVERARARRAGAPKMVRATESRRAQFWTQPPAATA